MTDQRGFTLLEMAMVIALLAMVIGGGVVAFGPVAEQTRISQTKANMDQVESALLLFAIRNGRLPCPADGALASSSVNYGVEVSQTGAGTAADTCTMTAYTAGGTVANSVIP